MNDEQFKTLAGLLVTLTAMLCITGIALAFDGGLALIAVGALIGLLAPSPFQLGNNKRIELVELPAERVKHAPEGG